MAYATPDDVRAVVNLPSDEFEAQIQRALDAATASIDRFCNRPDGFLALEAGSETAREFSGEGKPYIFIDENVGVTLVEVKLSSEDTTYETWAASDWLAFSGDPRIPDFNHTPYHALMVAPSSTRSVFTSGLHSHWRGFPPLPGEKRAPVNLPTVRVTARWGFAEAIPPDITEAAIIQTARWMTRGRSMFADTVGNRDVGVLMFRKELDPDVKQLLVNGRYVRPAGSR